MIKTTSYIALVLLIGGGAFLGCQPREKKEDQTLGKQEQQTQKGEDEGVVEEVEPVGGTELGGTSAKEGEVEIEARKKELSTELVQYQIPTVEMCEQRGDINKMEAKHFEALGVSPDVAQRIVQQRDQSGPFRDVSDLKKIKGVDHRDMKKLENKVGVAP